MRITNRVYNVSKKYLNPTYITSTPKYVLKNDLEVMGVDVKSWLDEQTLKDIAVVVARRILENGVNV